MVRRTLPIALLCLLFATSCALIDSEPAGPQIRDGIPSSAYLFVHSRHTPEIDFLDPCYDGIFSAFEESGFVDAVCDLIAGVARDEGGVEIGETCDRYRKMIAAVDWKALVSTEFVFGIEAGEMTHHHTVLGRMAPEIAVANYDALAVLLDDLAGLDEQFVKVDWQRGEARGITLDFGHPDVPVNPTVACAGEVMVLSLRRDCAETALDLVFGGETEAVSLCRTERFAETFARLPPAGEGVFYMEPAKIFSAFDSGRVGEQTFRIGPDEHSMAEIFHLIEPYINMTDRLASVFTTKDRRYCEDSIEIPAADWRTRPVTALFRDRAAPGAIDELVPANALSFSVSNGIDPVVFYDMLVDLFGKIAPAMSEPLLMQWDAIQNQLGIRLRDEWLACVDGGCVSVSFPAKRPSQFVPEDSISMIRLRDVPKAAALFEQWAGILMQMIEDPNNPAAAAMAQMNVRIELKPVVREGFSHGKKVSIAVMPFIQPVLGFHGDSFVIASSEDALDTYLAFLEGDEPGILASADFNALALDAPAGARAVSFTDLGANMGGIAQALQMSGMFTMMIPETEETELIKKIFALAPLLAPVFEAMDFLGHQGTYSVFDEESGVFRGRRVILYRVEAETE